MSIGIKISTGTNNQCTITISFSGGPPAPVVTYSYALNGQSGYILNASGGKLITGINLNG